MSARFASPLRLASPRHVLIAALLLGLAVTTVRVAAVPTASWHRRALAQRGPSGPDPVEAITNKDAWRAAAAAARPKTHEPPFGMACGDLSLVLDSFGGFGSASAGGDALFDAGSGAVGTVFEAMTHLRNGGFLDADSQSLPQSYANARRDGDAVVTSYVRGPFLFEVRTSLVDCARPHAAALVQEWTVTNTSSRAQGLALTPYVDGDLFFAGDHRDDFGVRAADRLWQFDVGTPSAPAAYVALTSEAPLAIATTREIGEYVDQRRRINRNFLVRDGLVRADGSPADADGDGVTDSAFDVSLAISHDFGQLDPGAVVAMVTRIEWGVARLDDIVPRSLAVDFGPDRVVECEGREGTLVTLSAAATPEDDIVAWTWLVNGALAGSSRELPVLLPTGDHAITVRVEARNGRQAEDSGTVTVRDTTPPTAIIEREIVLWPPDHRMVRVDLPVALSDACSDATLRALRVTSSQPPDVGRGGDGKFLPDFAIVDGVVWLRRERQGAEARVYTIEAEARDQAGHATRVTVLARVPHDGRDR